MFSETVNKEYAMNSVRYHYLIQKKTFVICSRYFRIKALTAVKFGILVFVMFVKNICIHDSFFHKTLAWKHDVCLKRTSYNNGH